MRRSPSSRTVHEPMEQCMRTGHTTGKSGAAMETEKNKRLYSQSVRTVHRTDGASVSLKRTKLTGTERVFQAQAKVHGKGPCDQETLRSSDCQVCMQEDEAGWKGQESGKSLSEFHWKSVSFLGHHSGAVKDRLGDTQETMQKAAAVCMRTTELKSGKWGGPYSRDSEKVKSMQISSDLCEA